MRLVSSYLAIAVLVGLSSARPQLRPRQSTVGQPCNTVADCGSDAPVCDFPWIDQVAPYNNPQRICRLSAQGGPCSTDAQCSTGYCAYNHCRTRFSSDSCGVEWDCNGVGGTCGTDRNVLADGSTMRGKCLRAGGQACTDPAQCMSFSCVNNKCGPDTAWGLGVGGQRACNGNIYDSIVMQYKPAMEVPGGMIVLSPQDLGSRWCAPSDIGRTCSVDSDCIGGWCTDSGQGGKTCARGRKIGASCDANYHCASGRCAFTSDSSLGSVCTYVPVGAGAAMYDDSFCSTGTSYMGYCALGTAGGPCVWNSDCPSRSCVLGACAPEVISTTTSSSTTTTSSTSTDTSTSTSTTSSTTTDTSTSTSSSSTPEPTSTTSTTTSSTTTSSTTTSSTTTTPTPTRTTTTSTTSSPTSTSSSTTSTTSTPTRTATPSSRSTTTTTTSTSTPTSRSSTSTTSSRTSSSSTSSSTSSRSTSTTSSRSTSSTSARSTTTTSSRSLTTSRSTSSTRSSTTTTTTTTRRTTTTTPTPTQTLLALGAACNTNTRCASGYCRAKLNPDGTRATQAYCDVKKASGAACYQNAGCVSGTCNIARGAVNGICK